MSRRPLLLHFVWIGARFPYYCRLAIESAIVAMPDASIALHVLGERPDDVDFCRVALHPKVDVRRLRTDEVFEGCPGGAAAYSALLGRIPGTSPAAISNLLRLAILHRCGGVYLDTDVIVVGSLDDPLEDGSYVGVERVWSLNRRRVESALGFVDRARSVPWAITWAADRLESRFAHGHLGQADHSAPGSASRLQVNNAVVGAPPGASFVTHALECALEVDPCVRYALGPSLLDDVARLHPKSVHIVPPSHFYPVPPGRSYRLFEDRTLTLPAATKVVHYVASNHRRLLSSLHADDRRFDAGEAVFWREAGRVRRSIAAPLEASA